MRDYNYKVTNDKLIDVEDQNMNGNLSTIGRKAEEQKRMDG